MMLTEEEIEIAKSALLYAVNGWRRWLAGDGGGDVAKTRHVSRQLHHAELLLMKLDAPVAR